MYARHQWIAACNFHPANEPEVLQQVIGRISQAAQESGLPPVVVFDIDSTLYHVTPRTYEIIRAWLANEALAGLQEGLLTALGRLQKHQVGYSLRDTFAQVGLQPDSPEVLPLFHAVKDFWGKRFFSNDFLHCDEPYEGAADYVQQVFAANAQVVYLTGRDEPGMGQGTRARMRLDGFPMHAERTHFFLKPSSSKADRAHKEDAADAIGTLGHVVASFENEPANLVALQRKFPAAMHIFVETDCSDHPAELARDLYRIKGFRQS